MKRIAPLAICAVLSAAAVFAVMIEPVHGVFSTPPDSTLVAHGYTGSNDLGSDARKPASALGKGKGQKRGLWVFGGSVVPNPITTTEGRDRLVNTSSASGITDIYLSVYRPTLNASGRRMYETSQISALVSAAHAAGLEVWVATGDAPWPAQSCSPASSSYQRMQDVVGYNNDVAANERFDGVMLDVEPAAAFDVSTFVPMHECFRGILPPSIKLGSAINAFWQDSVEYPIGGDTKPEYAHIIDLPLDQVVVMGYRDTAGTDNCPTSNGLICLDRDEIAYADSVGKSGLILVGIETINVVPGQPENVSFFEEGHVAMALESSKAADHFADNDSFGGVAIHNYSAMFLNGSTSWPAPETVGFCSLATNIEVESSIGTALAGYSTLGAAFAAINAGTHTGTIAIDVCGNTTELTSATLNSGSILPANYSEVSVRPVGAQRIIEGSISGAVIRLNGADNVTIDGRLHVGENGRDLTVRNNSTVAATAAIWLSSVAAGNGATNNTVRNLEISAGTDSTASGTTASFGIAMSGAAISTTSNGTDNDNNRFLSNRIIKARYGIMTRGTTTNLNIAPLIENNIIGSDSFGSDQIARGGIFVQADTGGIIRGNIVQNVGCLHTQACTGADRFGIGVGNESWNASPMSIPSNTYTVEGNIVRNVIEEKNNSSVGINLGTTGSGSPTNNLVANNFVLNVRANGQISEQTIGIGIAGGHTDVVVNNSIAIYGDVDPGTTATASAYGSGIRLPTANGVSNTHANITLRNNSIYLDLNSNDPNLRFYAISGRDTAYSFGTGGQDTNNYYLNPANPQLRTGGLGTGTGLTLASEFPTLTNWKTAYSTPQDASSIQTNPLYVSLADLHLQAGSPMIGQGVPVAGVTDDIDGDARDALTPDIGADEFVAPPAPGTVQFSAASYSGDEDAGHITVTVTRAGGSSGAASVNYGVAALGISRNSTEPGVVAMPTGGFSCTTGVDYITPSGILNWADDETAGKSFQIQVCPDTLSEPDESLNIELTDFNGATAGSPTTAAVTILNDDPEPPATFTVVAAGDAGDANPGDGICVTAGGICTLRAAVQEANALAGEQTIEFEFPAATLGMMETITLSSGTEIVVTDALKIHGPGAGQLTIDGGNGTNRIFSAGLGVSFELTGITLTGGNGVGASSSGVGGAVLARGDLTLEEMHFTANDAASCGGAVAISAGTHVIRNTTYSGNTSANTGGGLCATTNSNLTIENCTFSGNTAASGGGGILHTGASLLITNSTIFANTGSAGGGGGLRNTGSNVTVRSSIIAGNTGDSTPEISSNGAVFSDGFNLVGDDSGDSLNTEITYQPTDIVDIDPRLAPLANYGGPTPTHRPFQTSPIKDKGNSFGLMTEQRGFARIYDFLDTVNAGDGADIGAVEILAPSAAAVSLSGRVFSVEGTAIRGVTVTIFGGSLVEPITVSTGTFGAFAFTGLRAGETYFVSVFSGRYAFDEPVRTVTLYDDLSDFEFVAVPR